jgi:hypothetical protein
MYQNENPLGFGINQKPAFVGAKRKALRPRGSVLYYSTYRTKVGSFHVG